MTAENEPTAGVWPPPPNGLPDQEDWKSKPFRPVTRIGQVAIVFLVIGAIAYFLELFCDVVVIYASSLHSAAALQTKASDSIAVLSTIESVCLLVAGIPFLIWLYRACANLTALGVPNPRFSPGWAVGSYFVPFLGIYCPFLSMREVWNGSMTAGNHQSTLVVGLWWWLWIAANALGCIIGVDSVIHAHNADQDQYVSFVYNALFLASSLLAVRVVATVSQSQVRKHAEMSARS
jgi:hypothetical protein